MKKIVTYKDLYFCEEGAHALVLPIDHPDSERVSNTKPVRTSCVIRFDLATGEFETMNTVYRKAAPDDVDTVSPDAFTALVESASELSYQNKARIAASTKVGCYFCLNTFEPKEVDEWTDDGKTALCPHCGVDALIADSAETPLSPSLLVSMLQRWFTKPASAELTDQINRSLSGSSLAGTSAGGSAS